MNVNILTENKAKTGNFLAEHGLSILIEHENTNILFDTGQSDVYCRNAAKKGIDLTKTDCIVLSHGHYDHCGGLLNFPATDGFPKIFVHKIALKRKFAVNPYDGGIREIGISWSPEDASLKGKVLLTEGDTVLAPNIMLSSEIPSTVDFEEPPQGFYTENLETPDLMQDEQMLIINSSKGLYVFLGCSHPGVCNCLNQALKLFPGKKIYALFAGMHLEKVTRSRLEKTIGFIRELDIPHIFPLHCTGVLPICEMKHAFGDTCSILYSGDSIEI